MKITTRFLLAAIALILLLSLFACKSGGNPNETDDLTDPNVTGTEALTEEPGIVLISPEGETDYQLVRPENSSAKMTDTISALYRQISEKYGASPSSFKYTSDWEKEGATRPAREILIGDTNREESQSILAQLGNNGYAVALVGEKLVVCGKNDESTMQAIYYFTERFLGGSSLEIPENFSHICLTPPEIISYSPENLYYYEDVYTPTIKIKFTSDSEIDLEASSLTVGGEDFTSSATWDVTSVTLSGVTFEAGDYEAQLTLVDADGDIYRHKQNFSCGDGSVMNLYRGEVHSHTSESDGAGTVTQAYEYARDIAKLDFFAVTDHSNSMTRTILETKHAKISAELNQPGSFAAIYGYEQTYNINSGYFGHLNVLNTLTYTTRDVNLTAFYKIMARNPDAVVMFNHPGYSWGNFLEYGKYDTGIDKVLNLSEIKGSGYDIEYALSLTKGWHVSPIYNEDNHSANWGNASDACGYALAPSLTRQNIIEAFQKNRTYTTTDGSLKIYYKINGEWMGSRLDNPDSLEVSVEISTDKPIGIGIISLVAEDNIVVATATAGSEKNYTWNITLTPEYDYYYIKVQNSSFWAATAPVWIENRDILNVTGLEQSLLIDNSGDNDYGVRALVKNSSASAITDVTVSFYKSATSGFRTSVAPFATVNLGTLAAGAEASAEAFTSYSLSANRVTAILTGKQDGKIYGDTSYTILSQLYMTEVLPLMPGFNGVTIPFCYMELYNNSDTTLNLSSYSIRYYPSAGSNVSKGSFTNNTWNLSGTIKPHSTLVVWFKSSDKLTVADFNEKFGTNLVEGENLLVLSNVKTLATAKPVQLELLSGSTVVNRIWYNWGENTGDVKSNKSINYDYNHFYTQTSVQISTDATPSPGKLTETQVPVARTK